MIQPITTLLGLLTGMAEPTMAQEPVVQQPQQNISTFLTQTQIPDLKPNAIWGTQTKYPEKVLQSATELQPLLNQLSESQKQTAEFIAQEALKRNINPGFAIAQAFHETYRNKNPETIFSNPGGNLTGMKATANEPNYAFVRTFEKITPQGWITELQKRPWIIFQSGTQKQDKNIINTTEAATNELNNLLQQARKTQPGSEEWVKLQNELSKFKSDEEGKLAISIKDRFKKFKNEREGIINSLELLKKKIK